jgi:hypothetical protein
MLFEFDSIFEQKAELKVVGVEVLVEPVVML